MTTPPYSGDDLAWAKNVMLKYDDVSNQIVDMLVKACQMQSADGLASIVRQLHTRHDVLLLNQILGNLTTRLVKAESEAHGPLVSTEDEGVVQPTGDAVIWQSAANDQCNAALAEGNIELFAKLALDGQLRAAREDQADGWDIDFDYWYRSAALMHHSTLAVVAAETLSRLFNGGER